jgi:hypothetical protein
VTAPRPGFDSPEAPALATWQSTPSARAHVVSVDARHDRADVVIDTDPSHPDWAYCVDEAADGSSRCREGPSTAWDDPDLLDWG